jgi:hypothetical protein
MSAQLQPCPPGATPMTISRIGDRRIIHGTTRATARKVWRHFQSAELWRRELISELPDDLFEMLLEGWRARRQSSKSLAAVAVALGNGGPVGEIERCPHCGGTLRVRPSVSRENIKIVVEWLHKREAAGPAS